jgi:hypothetical protein
MKLFTAIDQVTSRVGLLNNLIGFVADKLLPHKTAQAACGPWCYYGGTRITYSCCGCAGAKPGYKLRYAQICHVYYKYGTPGSQNPCNCLRDCITNSTSEVPC